MQKRQALIPFPRTGKRASSVPIRHSIRAPNKYGLNLLETEGYPLGLKLISSVALKSIHSASS